MNITKRLNRINSSRDFSELKKEILNCDHVIIELEKIINSINFQLFIFWVSSQKFKTIFVTENPEEYQLRLDCQLENIIYCTSANLEKILNTIENPKSKVWFTSDTHFNEERTMNLWKRPFQGVEAMNNTIIENWNAKISKNDVVYHLGDFGDFKFLSELNFKKMYFLLGNYDKKLKIPENEKVLNQIQ